jgi:DNA polymerase III subunit delta
MQVRSDALAGSLQRGLGRLYLLHGDEPLQMQEAADQIRSAALAAGHTERQVHTVSGAHFNWSGLLGASQSMSLFAERQLVEIRIPSGKPGKDGSEALQRYAETLNEDVLTLVLLPRLDRQQQASAWFTALDAAGVNVRIDPIERTALPAWLARRLAAQGQRVRTDAASDAHNASEGERSLAFLADRVEGNLLAAHQELQKLALLYPAGELSFEQIEAAVNDVARYDASRLCEAALLGRTDRVLRVLQALQAEGESPVRVHWLLAEEVRAIHAVQQAVAAGLPMPMALRQARVWGARERWIEQAAGMPAARVADLLEGAARCDAITKGLPQPGWPSDPWLALLQWSVRLSQSMAALKRQNR